MPDGLAFHGDLVVEPKDFELPLDVVAESRGPKREFSQVPCHAS